MSYRRKVMELNDIHHVWIWVRHMRCQGLRGAQRYPRQPVHIRLQHMPGKRMSDPDFDTCGHRLLSFALVALNVSRSLYPQLLHKRNKNMMQSLNEITDF